MDNIFGPSGNVAGIIVFIAGLIMTYFSLTGLILILTGAFVGFTSTGTLIDFNKKRVKYSVIFFGFIPIGKWTYISPDMKIIIKKINKVWRT